MLPPFQSNHSGASASEITFDVTFSWMSGNHFFYNSFLHCHLHNGLSTELYHAFYGCMPIILSSVLKVPKNLNNKSETNKSKVLWFKPLSLPITSVNKGKNAAKIHITSIIRCLQVLYVTEITTSGETTKSPA